MSQIDLGSAPAPSSSNSFETISTPNGTSPVADSSTDTLTLTSSGSTVTITGTAASDTVNFEVASSYAHSGSGTDNRIVRWDGTANIQDSSVTINDTGQILGIAGTKSAVSFGPNNDVNTGIYSSGSDELGFAAGGALIYKTYSSGFAWFDASSESNFVAGSISTSAIALVGTNVPTLSFSSASTAGSNYILINTSSGGETYTLTTQGSSAGDYVGGFNISGSGSSHPAVQIRRRGQIILGGNSSILNSVSVVSAGYPDTSNIGGTTTANASTTITGSGTSFISMLGVGDRISLSSASSTYATVTAIASNTSLTVDTALGNGTSQTINRKRAIHRWDDGVALPLMLLNDQGHLTLGGNTTASEFRLLEPSGSGTNYTGFKAQAQSGNITYTLPSADGTSGYQLTTNGSGTLSWTAGAEATLAVSSNISLVSNTIHFVDTTSARTLTFPNPATAVGLITIKDATGNCNANPITLARFGSEEIEGLAASKVHRTDWGAWTYKSDGTDWYLT